jgi:hypothetical protein
MTDQQCNELQCNESTSSQTKAPTVSIVTKKRYTEFKQHVIATVEDDALVEVLLTKFQEVFKFDPCKPAYNTDAAKRHYQKLKTMAQEQGTSLYTLTNQDLCYQKHKEERNKKSYAYQKQRKSNQTC